MMLLSAQLRLRRSVKMKPLDTPQSPDVPRSPGSSVRQLVVDSSRELRSALTKPRLLSKMLPRNSVLLSPNVPASMLPSLSPSLNLPRNVLMSPRRSAPGQEPTQGRSRSQLSRNGAMCLQRNLVWLKYCSIKSITILFIYHDGAEYICLIEKVCFIMISKWTYILVRNIFLKT